MNKLMKIRHAEFTTQLEEARADYASGVELLAHGREEGSDRVPMWAVMVEHDRAKITRLENEVRRCEDPQSQVGEPATYSVGSDRYTGIVVAVSQSGETITIIDDGSGAELGFSLRKNSRFKQVGADAKSMTGVSVGFRNAYRDPSF